MRKSKVVLKRHIFIDMSNSSTQSVDRMWTVDTSCSMVILFIVGLLNPSRGIFVVRITGNSDYKNDYQPMHVFQHISKSLHYIY
jgi:hypothetical protein